MQSMSVSYDRAALHSLDEVGVGVKETFDAQTVGVTVFDYWGEWGHEDNNYDKDDGDDDNDDDDDDSSVDVS